MTTLDASNPLPIAALAGHAGQLRRLFFDTEGQDLVEYALLTAFIGFAGAAAWSVMLTSLGKLYGGVADAPWDLWEPADPLTSGSPS